MKLNILNSSFLLGTLLLVTGCGTNSTEKLSTPKVGQIKPMSNLDFTLGTITFSNNFELNATWGMGSAAAHKAGDNDKTFYTMTDRGVNIKCKDDVAVIGIDICAKGKIFPFPKFTPTIMKFEIDGTNAKVTKVISIKDKDAKPMTGVSNPLSNFTEKAYNIDGSTLAYDTNGLDAEALAVMADGSFWISDEYAPSIAHISAEGIMLERLIPKGVTGLENANYNVKSVLPAIIAKRHENRGIESIAISPNEQFLYFSIQSPLDNPDYSKTPNVRLYKMDLNNYNDIKEYLYVEDNPATFIKDNVSKTRKQKDVKISEMTALDNDILMVLERVSATTKLYRVDLRNAIEIPINISNTLETNSVGATALPKVKIFDTDSLEGYPNKIEGIANLGGGKFLLINDNDFGIKGDKTVMKVININVNP